jgi:hypothetical protein
MKRRKTHASKTAAAVFAVFAVFAASLQRASPLLGGSNEK